MPLIPPLAQPQRAMYKKRQQIDKLPFRRVVLLFSAVVFVTANLFFLWHMMQEYD